MAGGIYTCLNGGSCINNNGVGVCQCASGYSGTYCATALGCNAGGSFACQNNGACNSATGACSCPNGYTGNYCATCKILINIIEFNGIEQSICMSFMFLIK